MSTDNLLSVSETESVIKLNKAGYRSVFDIINKGRDHFIKTVPDMNAAHAREIYRQAREHAETLKSLFRSWQLRQEPVIGGLKKLAPSPSSLLQETLLRNLGGDGDFSDLMARSADYADAASIQSLFSPGRYAVALYKVARNLHVDSSAVDINSRRPDLQNLILSETTMNQEITSLDLLLEILQGNNSDNLNALSKSFSPMSLPYDDKLTQINAAVGAQGRTLNGIWDSLSDIQASSFAADGYSIRSVSSPEVVSGQRFFLKTEGEMVWLSHATAGGAYLPGAHLNVGKPSAAAVQTAPLHITQQDGLLYLGIDGDVTLNDISLSGCYLMADSGEDNGNEGNYARMGNTAGNLDIKPARHLAITLEPDGKNGTWLKTSKGYIGHKSSDATDWPDALTVTEPNTETALLFTLCKDDTGDTTISPEATLPPDTAPNPPVRTILNLTPVSYQLMANEALTEADIASHYGLKNGAQRSASDLVTQLNDISVFREKTGLTFNQILELTAQADYAHNATDAHNSCPFYKYGNTSREDVWKYGAAYLNSGLDDIKQPDERLLWVQPEVRDTSGNITKPAALNFTDDTLVSLAGNAEKLIRLRNTTGLSFEMLDWVIVNASKAAGHDSPVLDTRVLRALAACVDMQKRYGITPDTFVSFIGPVNPYARKQEKSFYESLFTSADLTDSIPVGGTVKYNGDQGVYESICAKALGATIDEFTRTGRYCFGDAETFTMSESAAGQIYRFGAIPRMLGLTFAEAECLWQLMAGGTNNLLTALGRDTGFAAIDLIQRTEQVLSWMADNNLNLIQVQAMVSTIYSGTATAEMFTFLQNVYHSVKGTLSADAEKDDALLQKVCRALAGGFGLKANIMGPVTTWLSKTDADFTLDGYWASIAAFFDNAQNTTVDDLQQDTTGLVDATQRLSQLVLVARWLNLSEQGLTLLTDTPAQLDSSLSATPQPDLPLLLLLTRFKRWQSQVTTSVDEALRLLPVLADDASSAGEVAEKIAALHNLTADSVLNMNTLLFGDGKFPHSFAQLYSLLTWLRTGQMLNVGSAALHDLLTMAQSRVEAEDSVLISRVANALTAGMTA
ncbi:Tc toxin subunit A [Intestinirhabdus alba]|jgi:hypothetical protein|uniref:Toxin n=1 Tax=Intestinirhabdus alba TaxID=2899544 RepID=A0A6L6ITR1_9ENTR|nr:Tc toxin subunit A [Intestinirhabdus alba]MTH48113.1 toxin [Intestinirhabdus alba]